MPLTPLNPHLVPPRGWGGVWGILRNIWWVCATVSSKPLPCTPKRVWVLSGMFGGCVRLTPLNSYLVPPRGWGGVWVLSGMFGGYVPLTPLNPYLVPPRGCGGEWGTLRNIWWVCAIDSSKPLPCTTRGWGGVWGILRNVWWVCATDFSKPSPCTPKGVGWGVGHSQECLVGVCH